MTTTMVSPITTSTSLQQQQQQQQQQLPSWSSSSLSSCRQVVSNWYQFWARWIRGLSEKDVLLEEWKSTIAVMPVDVGIDVGFDVGVVTPPLFLWIDVNGRTWKNLDFLSSNDEVEQEEEEEDDRSTSKHGDDDDDYSSLSYGNGAMWGGLEISLDDWQIDPLNDSYLPPPSSSLSSSQQQQPSEQDQYSSSTTTSTTRPPQVQYFRVTCCVTQTITPPLGQTMLTTTTSTAGAMNKRTIRRKVSAIVVQQQCQHNEQHLQVVPTSNSGSNGGNNDGDSNSNNDDVTTTAVFFSSRLVQLHESLILDNKNNNDDDYNKNYDNPHGVTTDPRDAGQSQGQDGGIATNQSSLLKAKNDSSGAGSCTDQNHRHHHRESSNESGSSSTRSTTTTRRNSSVPSTRRFIAPQSVLDKYGARPLLEKMYSPVDGTGTVQSLVGLSIKGWDIATSQGPIGDQLWFERALHELEPLAQPHDGGTGTFTTTTTGKGRKLVLPEMVFPLAHVVLEHSVENNNDCHYDRTDDGCQNIDNDDHEVFVSWDAMEALKEWSHAHRAIPMPNNTNDTITSTSIESSSSSSSSPPPNVTSSPSFRGVSVLQSSDADLWKQKRRQQSTSTSSQGGDNDENDNNSNDVVDETVSRIRNSEFHYDWTYSTPFVGRIYLPSTMQWQPLPESGMPMYLLTDTSVPILYYDHIVILEDDLHDNGAIEYTVKVRIMPHCVYVLARLFVRVDHVLVRVRDARWLVDFGIANNIAGGNNNNDKAKRKIIYRDITWREASWKDLGPKYQLPTQVQAWTTTTNAETPAFQMLLSKLPLVERGRMPTGIIPHAQLCYSDG